jgi:hypothetical protein
MEIGSTQRRNSNRPANVSVLVPPKIETTSPNFFYQGQSSPKKSEIKAASIDCGRAMCTDVLATETRTRRLAFVEVTHDGAFPHLPPPPAPRPQPVTEKKTALLFICAKRKRKALDYPWISGGLAGEPEKGEQQGAGSGGRERGEAGETRGKRGDGVGLTGSGGIRAGEAQTKPLQHTFLVFDQASSALSLSRTHTHSHALTHFAL